MILEVPGRVDSSFITVSLRVSKPRVLSSMKPRSSHPPSIIRRRRPFISATSVPGRIGRWRSASFAVGVSRGSAEMTFAPLLLARTSLLPIRGCCSKVLLPMTKMHLASSRSRIELVMAPEPKAFARAETVEEWQRRAQWSTLFVFITTRANFWKR